jgi:hypothetical protein
MWVCTIYSRENKKSQRKKLQNFISLIGAVFEVRIGFKTAKKQKLIGKIR